MTFPLSQTALIIAGHGSSKGPNQSRPARLHAQNIREMDVFYEVHTAFWKENTKLGDVLAQVQSDKVLIVPNLTCSGFINEVVIPREMGLESNDCIKDGRHIRICRPVGEHPGLAELIGTRVSQLVSENELDQEETTVFLVGHGNPKPNRPASHDATMMLAAKIYQHCPVHAILPSFIEEKPFLKDWRDRSPSKNIFLLPFMIAAGMHGAQDIPEFIGIDPTEEQIENMRATGNPVGPFVKDDKNIWLMRAVGSHPKIAEFIVDMARGV